MEDAAEIGRVLEPDTTGNHADAVVGPRQQLFGLVHPHAAQFRAAEKQQPRSNQEQPV